MRRKSLLSLVAAAGLAAATLTLTPAASGLPSVASPEPLILKVAVASPAEAKSLTDAGFDVHEYANGVALITGDGSVAKKLRDRGLNPRVHDSLYKGVDEARTAALADTYYGGYRTVAAHERHLTDVAAAHPGLAKVYDIGDSWLKTQNRGGHDIKAICLSKLAAGDCELRTDSAKPKLTIVSQIHAREIATGELSWRFIDYLANGYGTDADATAILDTTEVWLVPIANPDGVDKVVSGGNKPLLQRKNVNPTDGACTGTSIGVDLNRNSSYKWGGDSTNRCSETFQGLSAVSEPETQALENWYRAIYPDQRGPGDNDPVPTTATGVMLTVHSYGNDIIIPWGYTETASPNDAQLRALGKRMAASNGYLVGTNGDTVGYKTTGTTDDFTYGTLGVASFTFEVGPSGGKCGGFFPRYTCVDEQLWPANKGAFVTAAKYAGHPYTA